MGIKAYIGLLLEKAKQSKKETVCCFQYENTIGPNLKTLSEFPVGASENKGWLGLLGRWDGT